MKTILFSSSAAKELDRLPSIASKRIEEALAGFVIQGTGDVKALSGTLGVRMRVGDYRVIFDIEADHIHVLAIGHRKDIYR
jgi:mRNA interferase RelE/StbE